MRKLDRALKAKGFHQVSLTTPTAIISESKLGPDKNKPTRVIKRAWIK